MTRVEESFKATLQQGVGLEGWAAWLEGVVDSLLDTNLPKDAYIGAARQFLLRWSFYSSMIIRDLTLRSATSFGSFHLIRLLYDEFMLKIPKYDAVTSPMMYVDGTFETNGSGYVNFLTGRGYKNKYI